MMMEFESAHLYHPHVVKREVEPPSNWHRGEAHNFAMTGPGNPFAQSCGGEANLNDAYTHESDNNPYWSIMSNGAAHGQPMVLGQNNGYQPEGKGAIQATITPLDFGDGLALQDVGRDRMAAQDDSARFGPVDVIDEFLINAELDDGLWEQPQPYSNRVNSSIDAHATTVQLDSLLAFAANVGPSSLDLGYPLSPHSNSHGLAISQIDFPQDNTYIHGGQDDETSQIGYVSIGDQQYPNNFMPNPAIEQWIDPYVEQHATGHSIIPQPNDDSLLDSVGDLFTSEQFGFPRNSRPSHSYGLAVPLDGYSAAGNVSGEGSVTGTWESPRTQLGWESSSISPSPNPQIFMMPDPPLDDFVHFPPNTMIPSFSPPALTDMMGNFDINTDPGCKKRKRTKFSPAGKIKTNKVREVGACVSCHARKIPCAVGGVCEGCIKTAGDPTLAKVICLRTKLKDVYLSVKDIHYTLDERLKRLTPLLESLTGEPKAVSLTVDNPRLGYRFQLRLQVMTCASSPSCRWKRLTKVKGIYVTSDSIEDQRYVIVPRSLPSINDYDKFGRQILATSNGSHSGTLTQRLDEFLLGFCQNSRDSRLWKFADSTLRVASLSRLVAYGFLNLYDGSYDLLDRTTGISINENSVTRRYVSETVHDQLRILAAEGLAPVEKLVFGEIDNLHKHFGKDRNGKIVAGICVLRLMLLYRDRVIRDSIRLGLPRGGERHQKRLAKAAFMYKRLTIAYGTLCRESTPLIMTWEQEDEKYPTMEDEVMTKLFAKLQPAFESFCNEKLTPEYDDLLKGLIIEGSKIERRPSKKRKAEKAKVTECGGAC